MLNFQNCSSGPNRSIGQRKIVRVIPGLMASASFLALSAVTTGASAQCAPDPVMDGDEIICTGIDPDGFSSPHILDYLIVEAVPGSEINGTVTLIGSSNAFFNRGLVTGSVSFGAGNDLFVNGDGVVEGSVDLGPGNDIFVIDLDATDPDGVINGELDGGTGVNLIAYFTDAIADAQIALLPGFDRVFGIANAENSTLTLSGDKLSNRLDVAGAGTVVLNVELAPAFVPFDSSFGAHQGALTLINNPIDLTNSSPTVVLNENVFAEGDINAVRVLTPEATVIVSSDAEIATFGAGAIALNSRDGLIINRGLISGVGGLISFNETGRGENLFRNAGINEGTILAGSDGFGGPAVTLNSAVDFFRNEDGGLIQSFIQFGFTIERARGSPGRFAGRFENAGTVNAPGGGAMYFGGVGREITTLHNEETGVIEGATVGVRIVDASITNDGIIRGGANFKEDFSSFDTGFGEGLSLLNADLSNSSTGIIESKVGTAVRAINDFDSFASIENEGAVMGVGESIIGSNTIVENSGDIVGDITSFEAFREFAFFSQLTVEIVSNSGSIDGSITLGSGADAVTNVGDLFGDIDLSTDQDVFRDFGGSVNGIVNLGSGDDIVLVEPTGTRGAISLGIDTGDGFDSFGFSVSGEETLTIELQDGFEGVAVEALTEESVATIAAGTQALDTTLSLLGNGTIINQSDIQANSNAAVRLYSNFAESYFQRAIRNSFWSVSATALRLCQRSENQKLYRYCN